MSQAAAVMHALQFVVFLQNFNFYDENFTSSPDLSLKGMHSIGLKSKSQNSQHFIFNRNFKTQIVQIVRSTPIFENFLRRPLRTGLPRWRY